MGAGSWALWLMLSTVAMGEAPVAIRDRAISIPYNLTVNPAEVSEVVLYVSIDQGAAWMRAGVIRPTERFFAYQAPTDGTYWFTVATVYKNGSQVPADVKQAPPQQKVLIDTTKPLARLVSAERVGDEIVVAWDIQETNPDLTTLKLEYRPADSAAGFGIAVPVNPGLVGMARFRPTVAGPLAIRLSLNDTAGNAGFSEKMMMGPPAIAGVAPVVNEPRTTAYNPAPSGEPLTPPPTDTYPNTTGPIALASSGRGRDLPAMPAPTTPRSNLPELHFTNEQKITIDYEIEREGPSGVSRVEVYLTQDEGRSWMKWQEFKHTTETPTPTPGGFATPPTAGGPKSLPVAIRLPDREGVYGFRIIPYSGAEIGAAPPQAGDLPEVRVMLDRSAPVVDLYKPEADPRDPNVLVLAWKATDAHLAESPIRIYWSENPNGDWKNIATGPGGSDMGLANSSRYAWRLTPNMPVRVYLKITATDKAGNVNEAITPQPIVVDMLKPAGRVKGIVGNKG